MSTPPPKHLIENEPQYIPLWYRGQGTILANCGRRPPVLPRHLELVAKLSYVERADSGADRGVAS